MEKLLMVVITIALSSMVLASGTYYGNKAWQDTKAEAYAQQLMSGAATVSNAWRQWTKDNGGVSALTDYDWTDGAADLVPDYLVALPSTPTLLLANAGYVGWTPVQAGAYGITSFVSSSAAVDSVAFFMGSKGARVCDKIAEVARGKGAVPLVYVNADLAALLTGNKSFDCVNQSGTYIFLYRVFK